MSLAGLLVRDVTIIRPDATTDAYGAQKDWENATTTDVKGWLSQSSRSEDEIAREAELSIWHLTVDITTDLLAGDRVTVANMAGHTFEVQGPPNPAWTPRGAHHLEATLRLVEG